MREIQLTLPEDEKPEEKEVSLYQEEKQALLTPEEERQVAAFAETINLLDSKHVLEYGSGAQGRIASFSEKTLESVRTKDLGAIGDLLGDVVTELKSFDLEGEKGIKGFFKRSANKALGIKAKYAKAEANVETIARNLENHQITLMRDVATFDEMYELNASYHKELTMYIMAGKKRLEKARNEELPALESKANQSTDTLAIQEARDFADAMNRFEKKLHDLELTRTVSLQMAPQIRMLQASNAVMVEKIQSTLVNTIPLWKSQMVLALGALHTGEAARAQQLVTGLTNDLLRKNAEALHQSTVETARAAEESIVDVETLRHTNEELINALTEVQQIQADGRKRRQEAEVEIRRIEEDLKKSLLQLGQRR